MRQLHRLQWMRQLQRLQRAEQLARTGQRTGSQVARPMPLRLITPPAQSQHTGSQQEPAVIDSEPPAREASSTTNREVTTSPAAPATAEEMRKKQPLPARGKSLQLTHPHVPLPLAYWSGY